MLSQLRPTCQLSQTFAVTGQNGQAPIHSFPPTTARYARWEVSTSLGTSQNLGGMELQVHAGDGRPVTGGNREMVRGWSEHLKRRPGDDGKPTTVPQQAENLPNLINHEP